MLGSDPPGEATPLNDRGSSAKEEQDSSTSSNRILCYLFVALATALLIVLFNLEEGAPLQSKNQRLLDYPVISRGDFGPYKEYSVIHTDRSLNLMSEPFQNVMRDLNMLLKATYNADKVAIIPGYELPLCYLLPVHVITGISSHFLTYTYLFSIPWVLTKFWNLWYGSCR